jgi:UDP-2,4-diacetamido-2,4,6-trideoxy-beta-L-altropyranose hydrolase
LNIVFRTDANAEIGTGHLYRCVALAKGLKELGHSCLFVCDETSKRFEKLIIRDGFACQIIKSNIQLINDVNAPNSHISDEISNLYSERDALATLDVIQCKADFLVVDHYYLDASWEAIIKRSIPKICVIDDLANRLHCCDILVDQTPMCSKERYKNLVPDQCHLLCGSTYALLRSEFKHFRTMYAGSKRFHALKNLIISFGGTDHLNLTSRTLLGLQKSSILKKIRVTVILGEGCTREHEVRKTIENSVANIDLLIGVENMAEVMADQDLVIGAGGSSSLERCCLGLPSIITTTAKNQELLARSICQYGAGLEIKLDGSFESKLLSALEVFSANPRFLQVMSDSSYKIADGGGVSRVCKKIEECQY